MNTSDRGFLVLVLLCGAVGGVAYLLAASGFHVDVGQVGLVALGALLAVAIVLGAIVAFLWRIIGGYLARSLAEAGKREVDARVHPLPLRRQPGLNGASVADTLPPEPSEGDEPAVGDGP